MSFHHTITLERTQNRFVAFRSIQIDFVFDFYNLNTFQNRKQMQSKTLAIPKSALFLLLITILLGCLLTPTLCDDDQFDSEQIKVGEQVQIKIKESEGGLQAFEIYIDQYMPDDYFFLSIEQSNDKWVPFKVEMFCDIDGLKIDEAPVLTCENQNGDDICLVKGDKLKKGNYLIMTQCETDCKFSFTTYWDSVTKLDSQLDFQALMTGNKRSAIYSFKSQEKPTFFRFVAIPNGHFSFLQGFNLYASTNGAVPTAEKFQFESNPLWNGGEGLFIQGSELEGETMILLVGSKNSIYDISVNPSRGKHDELNEGEQLHDYMKQGEENKYHMSFDTEKDDASDIYAFTVETYMGTIKVGFYTDKAMKNVFQTHPVVYRGKSKYQFSSSFLKSKKITELYARLIVKDGPVTISSLLEKEVPSIASELELSVYNFVSMNEKTLLFFQFEDYGVRGEQGVRPFQIDTFEQLDLKNAKKPVFRLCKKGIVDCSNPRKLESASSIINDVQAKEKQASDSVKHVSYHISLSESVYKRSTKNGKKGIIVVEIDVEDANKETFLGLFYKDGNQITRFPAEQQYIEDTIEEKLNKYYYYQNLANDGLEKITFRLFSLSGEAQLHMGRKDPRDSVQQYSPMLGKAIGNSVTITENLQEPIILWVEGIKQSTYAIQVEVSGKKQLEEVSDVFKVEEDNQLQFLFSPREIFIFQIDAKEENTVFKYDSTGKIAACQINKPHDKCRLGNPIIGNKNEVKLVETSQDKTYVRLMNMNLKKSIEVTVSYHSGSESHCQKRSIGKIYKEVLDNNDCVAYDLADAKNHDIELMLVRQQLKPLKVRVSICGKKYDMSGPKVTITKQEVKDLCGDEQSPELIAKFANVEGTEKIKTLYLVQKAGEDTLLPDGIAFSHMTSATDGLVKRFVYNVVNKVDTEVIIHNKVGRVEFFAKIVDSKKYSSKNKYQKSEYDYELQSILYAFDDPRIKITQQDLEKRDCEYCVLVIDLYAGEFLKPNSRISYDIEVTQNNFQLDDHVSLTKFLSKGSSAYYKYNCANENSLYFEVSDNHMECSKIYVAKQEYPTEKNAIEISLQETVVVQCSLDSPEYFFTVEAIEDCPITVSAQSSEVRIIKVQRGVPNEFVLSQGQVVYFSYSHNSEETVKISSLQKFGDVEIFATKMTAELMDSFSNKKEVDLNSFSFKNTYKNQIEISPETEGFCSMCNILIAIRPENSYVDSEIVVTSGDDAIPITVDTVVYDEIQYKDVSKMRIFNALKGKISLTLNKGSLQFKASYKDNVKEWQVNNMTNELEFDFSSTKIATYNWDPVLFQIKNLNPKQISYYSFRIQVDNNPKVNAASLKAGVGSYLFLRKSEQQCVKGILLKSFEHVQLTVEHSDMKLLEKVKGTLEVNGVGTEFDELQIQNIKVVSVNRDTQKELEEGPLDYTLCFQNQNEQDQMMTIKIIQSGNVNVLQSNQDTVTDGTEIFMFHPEQYFLLDAFVCDGDMKLKYSGDYNLVDGNTTDYQQIDSLSTSVGNLEAQSSHANYFQDDFLTVFARFAPDVVAIARWMPYDQEKEFGTGYLMYKSGQITYDAVEEQFSVLWQPVTARKDQLKSKLVEVTYTVYIADTAEQAKAAANCGLLSKINFYSKKEVFGSEKHKEFTDQSRWMELKLQKQSIAKWFNYVKGEQGQYKDEKSRNAPQLLYVTISAEVTLSIPNSGQEAPETEFYRFLYNIEPVSLREVLQKGVVSQKIPYAVIFASAVIVAVLAMACLGYIILKKCIPIIGRLRRSEYIDNQQVGQDSKPTIDEAADSNKNLDIDVNV